jgi:hypothetical protein
MYIRNPSIHPPHNYKSTDEHPDIVEDYINAGLSRERISGPFPHPPLLQFTTSPLGVVPKSEPNKFRIIHDLPFPAYDSVNSNIPKECAEVCYDSINNVLALVRQFGKGSQMAKSDIKDAFRIVPVSPHDYHLLGFTWRGQFYYERCLPMGASSSCQIFEQLSTALQCVMLNRWKAGACFIFG